MTEYKPPKARISLIDHEGEHSLICIAANKALMKLIPMREYSELMHDILCISSELEALLENALEKYQIKVEMKNGSQAAESEQQSGQ